MLRSEVDRTTADGGRRDVRREHVLNSRCFLSDATKFVFAVEVENDRGPLEQQVESVGAAVHY